MVFIAIFYVGPCASATSFGRQSAIFVRPNAAFTALLMRCGTRSHVLNLDGDGPTPLLTTSAIFRALRSVDVDLELAHEAGEANHHEAGQNII